MTTYFGQARLNGPLSERWVPARQLEERAEAELGGGLLPGVAIESGGIAVRW